MGAVSLIFDWVLMYNYASVSPTQNALRACSRKVTVMMSALFARSTVLLMSLGLPAANVRMDGTGEQWSQRHYHVLVSIELHVYQTSE